MKHELSQNAGTVNRLIQALAKLPGIVCKSAQRLAYHMLRASEADIRELAESIVAIKSTTRQCTVCFNVSDSEQCHICASDKRDRSRICVVEQPQEDPALEHVGVFKGLYHVFTGALSPTDGIGTGDIRLSEFMKRIWKAAFYLSYLGNQPDS